MDNVTKRTLQAEMGDVFMGWAEGFFGQLNSDGVSFKYRDAIFSKEDSFEDFIKATKQQKWSPAKFKKAISAYCKWNKWVLNPKEMHNSTGGRIIKSISGKSQEVLYINTEVAKELNNIEKVITESEANQIFGEDI
jgi:hypothetical protein